MKRVKISLILNIIIVFLVTLGSIFMFTGFRFMPAKVLLEATKIEMFKFYTVDSNILMGIISLVFLIYDIKLLKHKIEVIPNFVYNLKLMATSAITLTFIVTLFFLAPQYGFYNMYNNTNLLFHLIVPVLAIISYIFFEKHNNKYRYALFGIIPMFIYSIYYSGVIFMHLHDTDVFKYDFYSFLQGNINNIYIVIPSIYLITYIFSLIIVLLNRRLAK